MEPMIELEIDSFEPRLTWRTRNPVFPKKKILILEDDTCLQPVIFRILRSIDPSIEVNWTTNLSEAVAALEKNRRKLLRPGETYSIHSDQKSPYSMILADILLPNMENGIKLWGYCQDYLPNMPFAFMSSFSSDEYLKLFEGFKTPPFIQKPFRAADCKQVLNPLLNSSCSI